MTGLTPIQAKTLAFIRGFIAEKGWSPTLDEIGTALGGRSKSRVHHIINDMAARGVLQFEPRRQRSIRVSEAPRPSEGIDFLEEHLAVWVRVIAARAGVTPLQVVNEAVRDAYVLQTNREPKVSQRTPEARAA